MEPNNTEPIDAWRDVRAKRFERLARLFLIAAVIAFFVPIAITASGWATGQCLTDSECLAVFGEIPEKDE